MNALLQGHSDLEQRKVEQTKRSSPGNPGRKQANTMADLKNVPGLRVEKRRK